MTRFSWGGSILVLAMVLGDSPAFAQDATGNSPQANEGRALEEIVVTARRKEESSLKVPVAVTAIGPATIERTNASDLTRIAQISPQIQVVNSSTAVASFVSIRGIGAASNDQFIEQSVLMDIDGMQLGRGRVTGLAMFDLQQVEVMKGPQSLFFGKNSPQGVISIKSRGPGEEFNGYIRAGYEFNARERYVEGALGGPLSDTFGLRLAVRADRTDGWLKNVAPEGPLVNPLDRFFPDVPGRYMNRRPGSRNVAARLTATWTPSSAFNTTLKVLVADSHNDGDAGSRELFCAPGVTRITDYGVVDPTSDCKLDGRVSVGGLNRDIALEMTDGKHRRAFGAGTNTLATLISNYSFGNVTLTSTTGYYHYKYRGIDNANLTSVPVVSGRNNASNTSVTQELRLSSDFSSPLNFVVGAFYEYGKRSQDSIAILRSVGLDPVTGLHYSLANLSFDRTDAYSGFGLLKWAFAEQLELSAGARYTKEVKDSERNAPYLHAAFAGRFAPSGTALKGKYKDDDLSPEVTLSWKPEERQLIYASYKHGYHSGGFAAPTTLSVLNNMGPIGSAGTLQYGPEKTKGGEIGYKGSLIDRSLRIELAAFRYNVTGLQITSFDPRDFAYSINNAGKARTQGFEASAEWRATQELTLRGAFGYIDAKYITYANAPCTRAQSAVTPVGCVQDLSGRQLPRAPKVSATGGADYDLALSDGLMLGFNADFKYTSSSIQQETLDPNARQKAYWLFNAGVRLYQDQSGWSLSLQGRNLTNRHVSSYSLDKSAGGIGEYQAIPLRTREVRIEAGYKF
ncbi:TonB-dependent receptor (plasmid) [Sphingobium sp. SJ10-10]|uniref:TonB-dependent receptor n=1 Tax=Sphingobium sp. SJ10-10 TaxID=3114999 RepID=UPI002E16EC3F|nr:TonB-dependent receptor [Sphingobium sp. SJ10-10]